LDREIDGGEFEMSKTSGNVVAGPPAEVTGCRVRNKGPDAISAADVWGGGGLELKWISEGKRRSKKVFSGFSGGGSLAKGKLT